MTCILQRPRARLQMTGDFDGSVIDRLSDVFTFLRRRNCTLVEVDAQHVTSIDAGCLHLLQVEATRLTHSTGQLRLVAASPLVAGLVMSMDCPDLLISPSDMDAHEPTPST